jgi:hypothetical protein
MHRCSKKGPHEWRLNDPEQNWKNTAMKIALAQINTTIGDSEGIQKNFPVY